MNKVSIDAGCDLCPASFRLRTCGLWSRRAINSSRLITAIPDGGRLAGAGLCRAAARTERGHEESYWYSMGSQLGCRA